LLDGDVEVLSGLSEDEEVLVPSAGPAREGSHE
jgi:hypothetical protein